jgi:hypothetical protein
LGEVEQDSIDMSKYHTDDSMSKHKAIRSSKPEDIRGGSTSNQIGFKGKSRKISVRKIDKEFYRNFDSSNFHINLRTNVTTWHPHQQLVAVSFQDSISIYY